MSKRKIYKLVVINLYFYRNNDIIAPSVWTSAFPTVWLFRRLYAASWCPNHAPDVETGESRGLQVSWRLYAAYVQSHARHRDRQISRSSGVSNARHCLLRALSLDRRCCRASTLSVAQRCIACWRFLVELSSTDMFHIHNRVGLKIEGKMEPRIILRYVQCPTTYDTNIYIYNYNYKI